MVKYLSQEWLDLQRSEAKDFPERPGASARMQYVVTGGPDGDVSYYSVVENGTITEQALGTDPEAEFTITTSFPDAMRVAKGELDANTAFMQGRVKVTGAMAKLMALMPLTQSPEYKAIQARVDTQTEY